MDQYCFLHFADFSFQMVFNFKNFSHIDHYLSNAILLLLLLLFRIHLLSLLLLILLIFIIINIISNSILCPIKQKEKRKKIALSTNGKIVSLTMEI